MTSSLRSIDEESTEDTSDLQPVKSSVTRFPLHLVAQQGQLHIHTTSYRGSFSLVLSEALRSAGLGSKVLIAQFLKGGVKQGPSCGENLCGNLNWIRPDLTCCIKSTDTRSSVSTDSNIYAAIQDIWKFCKSELTNNKIDRLVLDEIGLTSALGYIDKSDLISTLANRPTATDIILTGPSISAEIISMADQVTELR